MRFIIILMISFAAFASESVEIPSSVERLFDKASKDNAEVAQEALKSIKKRNSQLLDEVNDKISKRKSLRDAKAVYDTLVSNGMTRDQIISSANEDVRIIAEIYSRLEAEAVKGLPDYLPSVDEGDFMGAPFDSVSDEQSIIGTYSSPRWDYTISTISNGYRLSDSNGSSSIEYVKIGDSHVFLWSENNDIMVLSSSMILTCYHNAASNFDGENLPTDNVVWVRKLIKKE